MRREVEAKYKVPCSLLRAIEEKSRSLGFTCEPPVLEKDFYYSHPCRNFAETDEALRVRFAGGRATLTYKGPKTYTDGVKERLEIEVTVGDYEAVRAVLEKLGFKEVAAIVKNRTYCRRGSLVVTLDNVQGLGCFVEIEAPSPSEVERASRDLGLSSFKVIEATYLEMLLLGERKEE